MWYLIGENSLKWQNPSQTGWWSLSSQALSHLGLNKFVIGNPMSLSDTCSKKSFCLSQRSSLLAFVVCHLWFKPCSTFFFNSSRKNSPWEVTQLGTSLPRDAVVSSIRDIATYPEIIHWLNFKKELASCLRSHTHSGYHHWNEHGAVVRETGFTCVVQCWVSLQEISRKEARRKSRVVWGQPAQPHWRPEEVVIPFL